MTEETDGIPDNFILPADHPYVTKFSPVIIPVQDGFRVKWRDFESVKQDREFPTRLAAERCVARLKKNVRILDRYISGRIRDEGYEELSKFWRSL